MQNGYIESFNGNFRDECLNGHWFETLGQAAQQPGANTTGAFRRASSL